MSLTHAAVLALLSLPLIVGSSAIAQAVAVDLSSLSLMRCASSVPGGAPDQRSLPPGPLLAGGASFSNFGAFSVSSAQTQASAIVSWSRVATTTFANARLTTSALVTPGAGGSAVVDPQRLEVAFSATAPSAVRCTVALLREVSLGAPAPRIALDFDADGIIDVFDLQAGLPVQFFAPDIQSTPLRVQVLVEGVSVTSGYSHSMLTFHVVPDDPILVATIAPGCLEASTVSPLFGNAGVQLSAAFGPEVALTVAVVGFGQQPQLLPGPISSCLLIPTPDITLLVTPSNPIVLPLPASLRPLLFVTQNVVVADRLYTHDAASVFAW